MKNEIFNTMVHENSQDFFNYVIQRKLIEKDPKPLSLSSKHHFYYEVNEIKDVKTIFNLQKINYMEYLDNFLRLICNLQKDTILCGCFINNLFDFTKFPWNTKYAKIFESMLDSKMKRLLSEKNIVSLLNKQDYKVLNMKEINEIVYFHSIKK